MNLLNSISNFNRIANFNKIQNLITTEWSVLDTGLTSDHKIGKPTKYANSYSFHFALTGGSKKILRYNMNTGFSSSSANINPNRATSEIRDYTNLTNVTPNGNIFASIRDLYDPSPLTYASRTIIGTDGFSYGTDHAFWSTYSSTVAENYFKINLTTFDDVITFNDPRGLFAYALNNGVTFGTNLQAMSPFFNTNNDCKDAVYDGTSFILVGGINSTAKIARQLRSSFTTTSSWSSISNSFNQPISKIDVVQVYLNYSKPAWLPPEYYSVVQSSYTKILLIGGLSGKIARSTNGGDSWTDSSTQPFSASDTVIGFASGNIAIFAVTNTGKVAKSMDGGVNWTLVDIGSTPSSLTFAQSILSPDNQHKIYIGGANAFLASWNYEPISMVVS